MFHVFSNNNVAPSGVLGTKTQDREPEPSKRKAALSSLTRSCAECRRRRIKCDSVGPPCGQCSWYKVEGTCYFPARRRRNVLASRFDVRQKQDRTKLTMTRTYVEVHDTADKSSKILKTLFPTKSLDVLARLSRDELVELLGREPAQCGDDLEPVSPEEELKCIELSPQQDFEWDESVENRDPVVDVSDDVNGLSLALDNISSYLGISSITAIIRVIVQISPDAKTWIVDENSPAAHTYQEGPRSVDESLLPDEILCINAYFTHLHNNNPLVDEEAFRSKHLNGPHNDSPWIALFNMVLTMGSIAASDTRNHAHFTFYRRAYPHMNLESLGAGHLETVQALAILGGSYLHYLNKPNLASVIIGAALRMAVALGLHLEPTHNPENISKEVRLLFETRRRTWWCLFCFDTWASATLGRPSLGRWDPRCITADLPTALGSEDLGAMCLRTSVEFCKIGTAIQDRFARAPLISSREILAFDTQLFQWELQIPSQLRLLEAKYPSLRAPCGLLRSRYLNLRLVLHRPRLLISALRREARAVQEPEELKVIDTCREIAAATVQEIASSWFENQISAWNAVWLLFQATMIPLLGLFSDPDHEEVPKWKQSIENSLSLFHEMRYFSLTAERSHEVVAKIYEASKKARRPPLNGHSGVQNDWTWAEDQFWPLQEDMDWFSFPEFGGVTFDTEFLAIANNQGSH